ncbi:MAG: arylesterase, partial [Gammaproteobacteria bacterium]|nr:arylesterase [Gammaproteobacteria bacterium]
MKKLQSLFWVMLFIVTTSAGSVDRPILVLGDSLSAAYGIRVDAGWVSLLQKRLDERRLPWRVINGSVTGDTTAGGLSRLPNLLKQHDPAIVIIELGSNDGLRGLSFKQLRNNLNEMIDAVEHHGGRVMLVGGRLPPNYGAAYTEAFHRLFHEVAAERSLP